MAERLKLFGQDLGTLPDVSPAVGITIAGIIVIVAMIGMAVLFGAIQGKAPIEYFIEMPAALCRMVTFGTMC